MDYSVHSFVYKRVVIFVHLVQACNSGFVMVGNSVAVCEHFVTVDVEGIAVFAMLVTLVVDH